MIRKENSDSANPTSQNNGNKDVSDGLMGRDLQRSSIFEKILFHEIKKIFQDDDLSGTGGGGQKDLIRTIACELRKSKRASEKAQETKSVKAQEGAILKQFATENNL